jgi:DNA-binding CsgD family transcriptional regulator
MTLVDPRFFSDEYMIYCLVKNLSREEIEIAFWLTTGITPEEISGQINKSPSTIRYHLTKIYKKLLVSGSKELVDYYYYVIGEEVRVALDHGFGFMGWLRQPLREQDIPQELDESIRRTIFKEVLKRDYPTS